MSTDMCGFKVPQEIDTSSGKAFHRHAQCAHLASVNGRIRFKYLQVYSAHL